MKKTLHLLTAGFIIDFTGCMSILLIFTSSEVPILYLEYLVSYLSFYSLSR